LTIPNHTQIEKRAAKNAVMHEEEGDEQPTNTAVAVEKRVDRLEPGRG
jgi:hypothetical protein